MVFTGNAKDYIDEAYSYYNKAYIQHIKTQERIAIRAILSKHEMTIKALQKELGDKLSNYSKEVFSYHSENLVTQLKGAFEGKTADSAEQYLKSIPKLNLQNPIK
mgnify:FL=1|jgi:hypothetical protein